MGDTSVMVTRQSSLLAMNPITANPAQSGDFTATYLTKQQFFFFPKDFSC